MFTREFLEDILNNKPYGYWKQNFGGTKSYKVTVVLTKKEKFSETQTIYTKQPAFETVIYAQRKDKIGSVIRKVFKVPYDTDIQYTVNKA